MGESHTGTKLFCLSFFSFWVSLIGVGFSLGDLGTTGTGAGASILTTSRVAPLDVTSPLVLIVPIGLGPNMVSRMNFWFNFDNLANAGFMTKCSKYERFIGNGQHNSMKNLRVQCVLFWIGTCNLYDISNSNPTFPPKMGPLMLFWR